MEPQNKKDNQPQPQVDQNENQMIQEVHKKQDEGAYVLRPQLLGAQGEAQNSEEQDGEENEEGENQDNIQSNGNQQMEEEPKQENEKQVSQKQEQNFKQQVQEKQQKQNDVEYQKQEKKHQQEQAQAQKMVPQQNLSPEKPKGPKKKISQTQQKPHHHEPEQASLQPVPETKSAQAAGQIQAPPQPSPHYHQHHEKPAPINISFQTQRYINTLETTIKNKESHLQTVTQVQNSLQAKVLVIEAENKQLKSTQFSKIQQILQLTKKEKSYVKQIQSLKANVENLSQQLKSYREMGDIKQKERRIDELEALVEGQKKQIQILKSQQSGREGEGMQQKPDARVKAKEYIKRMDQLQNERDELEFKVKQLTLQLNKKISQNNDFSGIMNQVDKELKQKMERISELQENLTSERSLHLTVTQNLEQKIKSLESQLASNSYQSQSQSKQQQQGQAMDSNQSKSQLLQLEQQKQIIFREFLKLELENKNLQQGLKELKNKYQQACKDLRTVRKEMVSKKDYDEILIRYKKCRVCLEKAIKDNKILRDHRGSDNNNGEVDQADVEERNVSTGLLHQEENNIKKYMQTFNSHVQQSIIYLKSTNKIMENIHLENMAQEIKAKGKKIKEVEDKNQRLEKLNTIFERELLYKNTILDRVVDELQGLKKQYYRMEQEKMNIQENLAENVSAKSALKRLEVKSANLLIRNRKIVTEKQNWKALYEQLKEKYELFMARDPSFNGHQQPQNIVGQAEEKEKSQCEQGQIEQENAGNRPAAQVRVITANTQTQTQGLNQLYYKQIKQTLSAVKKFPQLIKHTTANYEKVGKELEEYKKKYEQANEKYNLKHRALNNEKQANDSWREQAKRQIMSQFQDIRELVESDRLLICLKKAKSLIEFLEQDEEPEEGEAK